MYRFVSVRCFSGAASSVGEGEGSSTVGFGVDEQTLTQPHPHARPGPYWPAQPGLSTPGPCLWSPG